MDMEKRFFVTGGAGFIGSALVRQLLAMGHHVTVFDAFTYAGLHENLLDLNRERLQIVEGDLRDSAQVRQGLMSDGFDAIFHLAAESHVDNSILGPKIFFETNVLGTLNLFETTRAALQKGHLLKDFRFIHVSTDEVFGSLGSTGSFTEENSYQPRSPYSASKAASDHVARAWAHTYGLPVIVTNCSNNYGPRQFPEKFIPRLITQALREEHLPVYGDGRNVRDWIYVDDHCRGLILAYQRGKTGETYLFGGRSEMSNLDIAHQICHILNDLRPRSNEKSYKDLIQMVADRPGHDFRYSVDCTRAESELGFQISSHGFAENLRATVKWYLENPDWLNSVEQRKKAG